MFPLPQSTSRLLICTFSLCLVPLDVYCLIQIAYDQFLANQTLLDFALAGSGRFAILSPFDIARKSTSLKQLEQLAQELPRLSPSGRPLSMASTGSSVPSSPLLTMAPNPLTSDLERSAISGSAPAAINGLTSSALMTFPPGSHTPSSPTSSNSFPLGMTNGHSKASMAAANEVNAGRTNWATTSHVIEHLQQTIDALRRDLNEQTAKAAEEKQGRDAIRKRCDKIESQLEGLRHQNETLNSIISRKERRVKELENDLDRRLRQVDTMENDQKQFLESKNEYESVLQKVKDDQERSESAYQAVAEGLKSVRGAYEDKFALIREHVNALTEERESDKDRISQLQNVVDQQKLERLEMEKIKREMALQRARHVKEIAAYLEGVKEKLTESEKSTENKVSETMSLVNEMKKTHQVFASQLSQASTDSAAVATTE